MPIYFVRALGNGLAFIAPIEGPVDPGFGGGGPDHIWGGVGGRPDRPDQGLPGGGYPSHGLPGSPGHPDNRPPATNPPRPTEPGATLVLVRDPEGVWHYATIAPGSPPPRPVPVPPPDHIANRPPGSGAPPTAGTPLPPTAAPKPA